MLFLSGLLGLLVAGTSAGLLAFKAGEDVFDVEEDVAEGENEVSDSDSDMPSLLDVATASDTLITPDDVPRPDDVPAEVSAGEERPDLIASSAATPGDD
ncbi:MAG: hypothetical protein JXR35_08200, partial [Rhodobacteraceae bacterium]|nr:hypothetical protein [Paracoccaceae bacterium]